MQRTGFFHQRVLPFCFLLSAGACQREQNCPVVPVPTIPASPEVVTTVNQVKAEPLRFLDREVRLVGDAEKIFSDRAFELDGTGWAFDDNITVLTKTPVHIIGGPKLLKDRLIVRGVVRRFDAAALETELAWTFPAELKAALTDRPVIIADTVDKVWHFGRWTSGPLVQPIGTLVTIIASVNLDALIGQSIALEGERVQAMAGRGIWVGPNAMSQIFVLPAGVLTEFHVGDAVDVSGVLRKVPADAVTQWKLPASMAFAARADTLYVDSATVTPASGRGP